MPGSRLADPVPRIAPGLAQAFSVNQDSYDNVVADGEIDSYRPH
jgi:hypothetical protein